MCAIRPVGSQRSISASIGGALALAGGAGVDHGAHRGRADLLDDQRRLLDRVDQLGLGRRERLDAVGDAGLLGVGRDRRSTPGAGERRLAGVAGLDRALLGRAVDQDAAAEIGAQLDQAAHDVEGARAHAFVAAGDREPVGRQQQIVQAGDREAVVLGDAAQLRRAAPPRAGAADRPG